MAAYGEIVITMTPRNIRYGHVPRGQGMATISAMIVFVTAMIRNVVIWEYSMTSHSLGGYWEPSYSFEGCMWSSHSTQEVVYQLTDR